MIYNKYIESISSNKFISSIIPLKKAFSFKNILFVILTLVILPQTFIGDVYPFGYAILGVASLFNVPLLLILISSFISGLVFQISSIILLKMFIAFVIFTFFTALVNIEGVSKKYVVLSKLAISIALTEFIALIFQGTIGANWMSSIYTVICTTIFYLIFVAGIYVILNLNKEFVYSKEESLAMIVVITIAAGILNNLTILNFSILNVLGIVLILIYGWKNGATVGSAAGLIVGLILSLTSGTSMLYITSLTFSGFISGLLSKVGKIGVILGFILGNLAITYWMNGFSELTVRLSEMIVASVVLFFIPKRVEVRLDKLFNRNNTLRSAYDNVLDYGSDVKNRLNAVSEVFDNLSKVVLPVTEESSKETRDVIKKYILEFTDNNCIDCKKRKKCTEEKSIDNIVEKLATSLENNREVDSVNLDINCDNSYKLIKDIKEIYNSMKLMRIIKQKEAENSVNLSNQYREVSKIISSVAENVTAVSKVDNKHQKKIREELKLQGYRVYEDEYVAEDDNYEYVFVTDILVDIDKQKKQIASIVSNIIEQNMVVKLILNSSKTERSKIKLISKPRYEVETYVTKDTKSSETICGDSYISMELEDLKHMSAISDGAGSGEAAYKSSKTVIDTLEKLLNSGFDESKTIEIVNSVMKLKNSDSGYATLDMVILNLKNTDAQFIKIGAAPTYIIEDKKVTTINSFNIPVGLTNSTEYLPISKKIKPFSVIIQITDGVIPDGMDIFNNYFTKYLEQIDVTKSSKAITDELYRLVIKENGNILKDDFTILVSKVKENVI